ncbi:MAG: deaminase [Thermoplasmata archaeon]|jgi:cytosine/adenosine deaminase-related metal-dependent hydrolase|nr:deaminase [Thermoplasmata archaeon]
MDGMSDGEIGGYLLDRRGLREGYAVLEGGLVAGFREGRPDRPVADAIIIRGLVDCHTHCADFGLRVPAGMSLQELVAPPDGLKHRYLREAPRAELEASMRAFSEKAGSFGVSGFIDFREGGLEGCEMLRAACPGATILGRPVSPELDPAEAEAILGVADGFGLPSITDMPASYCEGLADIARSRGRPLAIHASERIREDIDAVLSLDPAMVVHMCSATRSDISKCAEAEVPIAVCPGSNAYFGVEAPVAEMLACGASVVLGTDNGMLRAPDMVAEASLLMRLMESQGAPASAVWDVLSASCGKILYRQENHGVGGTAVCCAAVPLEGSPEGSIRGYRGGAVGLRGTTKE